MTEPLPEIIAAARDALGYDEVKWLPLTLVPLVAQAVDVMVKEGRLRIQLFTAALREPPGLDSVDEITIEQTLRLHHERVHFVAIWCEQIRRWRNENPNAEQEREIDQLEIQVRRLREINRVIFRAVRPCVENVKTCHESDAD